MFTQGPSGESIRGPPGQRGAPGLSGSVSGNNDAGYNHGVSWTHLIKASYGIDVLCIEE